ncbi:MAG: hypothetical protein R3F11_08490 [Verrucomicrobiales bacterium]
MLIDLWRIARRTFKNQWPGSPMLDSVRHDPNAKDEEARPGQVVMIFGSRRRVPLPFAWSRDPKAKLRCLDPAPAQAIDARHVLLSLTIGDRDSFGGQVEGCKQPVWLISIVIEIAQDLSIRSETRAIDRYHSRNIGAACAGEIVIGSPRQGIEIPPPLDHAFRPVERKVGAEIDSEERRGDIAFDRCLVGVCRVMQIQRKAKRLGDGARFSGRGIVAHNSSRRKDGLHCFDEAFIRTRELYGSVVEHSPLIDQGSRLIKTPEATTHRPPQRKAVARH